MTNGHLRSGEIVLSCGEIPRQQFVNAVDRVIGDIFEHTAEIKLRIKPVELGRADKAVHGCSPLSSAIGSDEQEVFSFPEQRPQRLFGRAVIDLEQTIFGVASEGTPS